MNNKIKLLILSLSFIPMANAKIVFPYSQFKEIEFANPNFTNHFENYIATIQKNDMKYSKIIDSQSADFINKYQKEKERGVYKKPLQARKSLGRIISKEGKNYIKVGDGFITAEISNFNNFANNVRNDKKITQAEKMSFVESVKPLHQKYKKLFSTYRHTLTENKTFCFVSEEEYEYTAEFCAYMYSDLNDSIKNVKQMTAREINIFITKYKTTRRGMTYAEDFQLKIDELKRYKDFNWEINKKR